jgi:hypothetical protein
MELRPFIGAMTKAKALAPALGATTTTPCSTIVESAA